MLSVLIKLHVNDVLSFDVVLYTVFTVLQKLIFFKIYLFIFRNKRTRLLLYNAINIKIVGDLIKITRSTYSCLL